MIGLCCGEEGGFTLRPNDFRLRWYHRRAQTPHVSPTSRPLSVWLPQSSPFTFPTNAVYAQLFSANVFFSTHEGYLSSLNRYIMSEIRRKLVIVGDGACGKVSTTHCLDPGQTRSCYSVCQDGCADGLLVVRRNLDLFVDCLLERNIP